MAGLTATAVRKLTDPGRYSTGTPGLYFNIAKGGSRSWVQRIRVDGKRTDKGLGGFPKVSLSAARRIADANRVAVTGGQNPWADSKPSVVTYVPTFREAAHKLHAQLLPTWKNAKHATSWMQTLEKHAFPVIGDVPVDEVTRADVLSVLEPIWTVIPENARRVRQRMRAVFTWAMAYAYIDLNPAGELVDGALKAQRRIINGHMAALPYQDVPDAIRKIRNSPAWLSTRLCFKFLILTVSRSVEARGARWEEIDLDARIWTIPPERMKASREHRQPLSIQAQVLLGEARRKLDGSSGLVFPTPAGKMLSENALSLRAKKDNLGCVPHGFRSSFRDFCAEQTSASWAAIELSLSHKVGTSVEAAYFRSDLIDQRRAILQQWADFLEPLPF